MALCDMVILDFIESPSPHHYPTLKALYHHERTGLAALVAKFINKDAKFGSRLMFRGRVSPSPQDYCSYVARVVKQLKELHQSMDYQSTDIILPDLKSYFSRMSRSKLVSLALGNNPK